MNEQLTARLQVWLEKTQDDIIIFRTHESPRWAVTGDCEAHGRYKVMLRESLSDAVEAFLEEYDK